MFCEKCGTQIEDDSAFCHNCGAKIERINAKKNKLEDNKIKHISIEDENKSEKSKVKKLLAIIVIIICAVILMNSCRGPKAPNESDIENAIMKYNMLEFSQEYTPDFYGQPVLMNNIDRVQINGMQTEEKSNITFCTVEMSNDSCKVSMNCNFIFSYYDDKKWHPEERVIESFIFSPVRGIDEQQAYNIAVENLHMEPETVEASFLGEDYTYNITYNLQLKEHKTDLNNNKDKVIYDYYKASDFCTETGLVEINYIFNTSYGSWEYSDISEDVSYEYHPEGQWRFDIMTHYYRINVNAK